MKRKQYPTDLNDTQWNEIKPLLPLPNEQPHRGRPTEVDYREIMDSLLYITRSGCSWDLMPHDFPPSDTVYYYFKKWSSQGIWEQIHDVLFAKARKTAGRNADPTLGIIDSQSVKTSAEASDNSGYDGAKKIKGRKRHIVVDILGNLMAMKVHDADISDRDGSDGVFERLFKKYPSIQTIMSDSAYSGDTVEKFLKPWNAKLEVVKKLHQQVGFVVLPKRWLVERLFGWLTKWRRLSKDYERLPRHSEAFIYLAQINHFLNPFKSLKPET